MPSDRHQGDSTSRNSRATASAPGSSGSFSRMAHARAMTPPTPTAAGWRAFVRKSKPASDGLAYQVDSVTGKLEGMLAQAWRLAAHPTLAKLRLRAETQEPGQHLISSVGESPRQQPGG